jgi:hypothetical protein
MMQCILEPFKERHIAPVRNTPSIRIALGGYLRARGKLAIPWVSETDARLVPEEFREAEIPVSFAA